MAVFRWHRNIGSLATTQSVSLLAMIFVGCRVLHGIFYLTNAHLLRSLMWFGGFGCMVALMAEAALRIA